MQPINKTFAASSGVTLDGENGNIARLVDVGEVNVYTGGTLTVRPAGIFGDAEFNGADARVTVTIHGPARVRIAAAAGAWPAGEYRFTTNSDGHAIPPVNGQYNVGYLDPSLTPVNGTDHDCFVHVSDAVHS